MTAKLGSKWLMPGLTGASMLLLTSCVTYPYESAFNSCESEANACYRLCEDIPDESGYVRCQSHCDRDIDRCFDSAYSSYRSGYYDGYGYGYGAGGYGSSPWYGRYGSWYPSYGYTFGFNSYDRYGYRKRKPRPSGYGNNPPPSSPPPTTRHPDDGRSDPPGYGNDRERNTRGRRQPNTAYPAPTPDADRDMEPRPNRDDGANDRWRRRNGDRMPRPASPPPSSGGQDMGAPPSGSSPRQGPAPDYTPPPRSEPRYTPPPSEPANRPDFSDRGDRRPPPSPRNSDDNSQVEN